MQYYDHSDQDRFSRDEERGEDYNYDIDDDEDVDDDDDDDIDDVDDGDKHDDDQMFAGFHQSSRLQGAKPGASG